MPEPSQDHQTSQNFLRQNPAEAKKLSGRLMLALSTKAAGGLLFFVVILWHRFVDGKIGVLAHHFTGAGDSFVLPRAVSRAGQEFGEWFQATILKPYECMM